MTPETSSSLDPTALSSPASPACPAGLESAGPDAGGRRHDRPIGPEPGRGVDADWLTARGRADTAARAVTAETLLPPLIDHLQHRTIDELQVVDLGAGRGANQRWLRPRLPFAQHWTHVDYDTAILHRDGLPDTAYVSAEVGALPDIIGRLTAGPVLVTCSALLDVLPLHALDRLCDDIVAMRVPALFSLSVTGQLILDPSDPDDGPLLDAFNAHQRRDQRAGPDAPTRTAERLTAAGASVTAVDTPWLLGADADASFLVQFLRERVAAAVEHNSGLAERGADWLERRLALHRAGRLQLTVGHRDLLVLPC